MHIPNAVLKVLKLSENATIPTKGSPKSAGYDVYSAHNYMLRGYNNKVIFTDLSIEAPAGTYVRIAPRSGLASTYHIDVGAGVVDPGMYITCNFLNF